MKSAVETLSPTRVRVSVEVPFDEAAAQRRRGVQEDRRSRSPFPASARAKCRRASSTSASDAARCSTRRSTRRCPEAYGDALTENDIKVLGQPDVEVTDFSDGSRPQVHRRGRCSTRDRAA